MSDPLINLGGTLTSQKYVIQNIGGTLTYPTKAIQNIGGTLTTVWQKSASDGWWNNIGLTASVLAQSKVYLIDYRGSGTITNVVVDKDTATFTVKITSTSTSTVAANPYNTSQATYNYLFGDFRIETPRVTNSPYTNPLQGSKYTTTCSNISTTYYVFGSSTATQTDKNNTASVNAFGDHAYIITDDISCASVSNTITVTVTVTFDHRESSLSEQNSLVTAPISKLSYSSTGTGSYAATGPYATTGKTYTYSGTVSFTLSSRCIIPYIISNGVDVNGSNMQMGRGYCDGGTIKLLNSSNTILDTLYSKTANSTKITAFAGSYTINAGTYKLQYSVTLYGAKTMPVPTVVEIRS